MVYSTSRSDRKNAVNLQNTGFEAVSFNSAPLYKDVAIYLQYAKQYEKAAEKWEQTGSWERAINAYKMSGASSNSLKEACYRMGKGKENRGNYKDATALYVFNYDFDAENDCAIWVG